MKRTVLILSCVVAMLVAGCATSDSSGGKSHWWSRHTPAPKLSDRELAGLLVGTWQGLDPTTAEVTLEARYTPDGGLAGWFWNHEKASDGTPSEVKVSVTAHWEIAGGRIHVTSCVTKPAGRLPASYALTEIVSINATEMVLRSVDDGALIHRRRKPE